MFEIDVSSRHHLINLLFKQKHTVHVYTHSSVFMNGMHWRLCLTHAHSLCECCSCEHGIEQVNGCGLVCLSPSLLWVFLPCRQTSFIVSGCKYFHIALSPGPHRYLPFHSCILSSVFSCISTSDVDTNVCHYQSLLYCSRETPTVKVSFCLQSILMWCSIQ